MIKLFLLNICLIWGLNFAAYNLFPKWVGKFSLLLAKHDIQWLEKPLYMCRPCMSSVWGVGFWVLGAPWYFYPIWVLCLAGASSILTQR